MDHKGLLFLLAVVYLAGGSPLLSRLGLTGLAGVRHLELLLDQKCAIVHQAKVAILLLVSFRDERRFARRNVTACAWTICLPIYGALLRALL